MKTVEQLMSELAIGAHDIIPKADLQKKLASGKKLVIKLGADPTAPDLHLGHAVVLSKLRQFQDLGHEIVFLIGDFTGRIGDPTGRSKTRPPLTEEQIAQNSKTYLHQLSKILDTNNLKIVYNSHWLDKLTSRDWLKLCAQVTVAQIIEREDFAKRLAEKAPIGLHELLYPLLQGYDSVALHADIELGGTDQTFNLLMGRHLQEQAGQPGQVIITVPLLEGLDGQQKMSKSYGNSIGLAEPAQEAFGKLMSISDTLMWRYYELLLLTPRSQVEGTAHPMELKKQMAHNIIARFWSAAEADAALTQFEQLFQKRDHSHAQEVTMPADTPKNIALIELLKLMPEKLSSSELRRRIEAGAVSIDGVKAASPYDKIDIANGTVVKLGKHAIYKIVT